MDTYQLTHIPAAQAGMLIRRPVAEVFEAFVDPEITSRFWFTKSNGRLEAGALVLWEWEMYAVTIPVAVKSVEQNRRIVIEWPGNGHPAQVELLFEPRTEGSTFVSIMNTGFTGSGDEIVRQVMDAVEGFTLVLAGLKALLEHNLRLNLVGDRFPEGIERI